MGFRVSLNDTNGSHMQCLLTVASAPVIPFGEGGTADRGAVALGNIQGIRVQLFILPYQNQYFVLSSCDIIGSNNLCAVF